MTDPATADNRYPRAEKLKSKRELDLLFDKGKWKTVGNLRIVTYSKGELSNAKIGVSVSKRNFKKAVHRNRIKRLLREAYRLNKSTFTEAFGTSGISMLFWVSSTMPKNYDEVKEAFLMLCNQKNK